MDSLPKFTAALRFAVQHRLAEILTYIIVFTSAGMGITLIRNEKVLRLEETYATVGHWAPLATWGTLLIVLAVLLGIITPFKMQEAAWISLGLTILYGLFTIGTAIATGHGGVPTAVWGYMAMAMVTGLVTLVMTFAEKIEVDMVKHGILKP